MNSSIDIHIYGGSDEFWIFNGPVAALDCVSGNIGGLGCATAFPTEWARRGFACARSLLNDVARAIDPQRLEGVEKNQQASALALIRTMFRQGLDLPENPERDPGWSY
jgi:hypothetical protein